MIDDENQLSSDEIDCQPCGGIAKKIATRVEYTGTPQVLLHRTYRCPSCGRQWIDTTDGD